MKMKMRMVSFFDQLLIIEFFFCHNASPLGLLSDGEAELYFCYST